MSKKSQAALEFLMTYGWAIMVVLAAIGALAYFGVLDPQKFISEKCVSSAPLTCIGGKAYMNSTSLLIVLSNNADYTLQLNYGNLSFNSPGCSLGPGINGPKFCDKSSANCASSRDVTPYGEFMIKLSGCAFVDKKFENKLYLNYTNPKSGLKETIYINAVSKLN